MYDGHREGEVGTEGENGNICNSVNDKNKEKITMMKSELLQIENYKKSHWIDSENGEGVL